MEHVGIHGDHFGSETRRAGSAERRQRRPRKDEEKMETKQKTRTEGKQMGEGSKGEEGIGRIVVGVGALPKGFWNLPENGGATRCVVKKLADAPFW